MLDQSNDFSLSVQYQHKLADSSCNSGSPDGIALRNLSKFVSAQARATQDILQIECKPGNCYKLPGNCSLRVQSDGAQEVGFSKPGENFPGPHETVTIDARGLVKIKTISSYRSFRLESGAVRETIELSCGSVVIRRNQIVELLIGGRTIEVYYVPSL